jgi:hypothetical protein
MYNIVNGVNQATFIFLPMLGKHPDEYPRFRDCFLHNNERPEYEGMIHVYTRVGGPNRESYVDEIEEMRSHECFVADFDDNFDGTYATYVFKVPDKWKKDFDAILKGGLLMASAEYRKELYRVYPKLKDQWDKAFGVK